MASYFLDAAQMTVSGTPGAGVITLGAAVAGYQTFAAAGAQNGQLIPYAIQDVAGAYEFGRGTYATSGTTLTRTTIFGSSNGGAAIVATAAAIVSGTANAEDIQPVPYMRGWLSGMTLANDAVVNTTLDVSPGTCIDSTNLVMINLSTAFAKTTSGAWVAGSGNAGMGAGLTIAPSTWYHVFAIINNGVPDVYFDTTATGILIPSGTTSFRRIGSFKTDSSSHILQFTQFGDNFVWTTAVQDVATSALGTSIGTFTLASIPPGVIVTVRIRANMANAAPGVQVLLYSPFQIVALGATMNNPVASVAGFATVDILAGTSQNIKAVSSANSTACNIWTYGWIDNRGKAA